MPAPYRTAMTQDNADGKAHIRSDLDLSKAQWRGTAPQVAMIEHVDGETYVAVRRSAEPGAATLVFTMGEWVAFADGVRDGEFETPA